MLSAVAKADPPGAAPADSGDGHVALLLERAGLPGPGAEEELLDHGRCVSMPDRSIMFRPGATSTQVEQYLNALPEPEFANFLPFGGRWTTTATNGPVPLGRPFTITYSFVPDGTFVDDGFVYVPSVLIARMTASYPGGMTAFRARVRAAFDRYTELTNITYVEVDDDGADHPDAPGQLGVRGDVRIGMADLGDGPLAVNYFPAFGGDMILSSRYMGDFTDSSDNFRSLRNIIAHEHGHGLGLDHVLPLNETKLMEPFLTLAFDGPQEDEIRAVQFLYGDWAEYNDTNSTERATNITLRRVEEAGPQRLDLDNLAIERSTGSDFFGVNVNAGAPIAIRVSPVGTTYSYRGETQGPGSNITINGKAVRNLGIRLWRRTSAQPVQTELVTQLNAASSGLDEYYPPSAQAGGGYMLVEVFASDSTQAPQRYKLSIGNSALVDAQPPSAIRVFDGTTELQPDASIAIAATPAGVTQTRTITIRNDGPGALTLGALGFSGPNAADFAATLTTNTVQPSGSLGLIVRFTPPVAGSRTAVMTINSNDPDAPAFALQLSGVGEPPPAPVLALQVNAVTLSHDANVEFGPVDLGQFATFPVVIRNNGNATLSITNMVFAGPAASDFSISQPSATLAAGSTVSLTMRAAPTFTGLRSADLRIFSNAQPSPTILHVKVQGRTPIIDCNGNSVDDPLDISAGGSSDCNLNGIPDECEQDSDGDGVVDGCDQFPGQHDTRDSDGDGAPDVTDGCPQDAAKTAAGACGCGTPDSDRDGDGLADCVDPQPDNPPGSAGVNTNTNAGTSNGGNSGGNDAGQDPPALTGTGGGCAASGVSMLMATAAFARWSRRRDPRN